MKRDQDHPLGVRLPPAVKDRVQREADSAEKSVSGYIRDLIETALAAEPELDPEIQGILRVLADKNRTTMTEAVEIVVGAYVARDVARRRVWGEDYRAPEFTRSGSGELIMGLDLVKTLDALYTDEEKRIRECPSAEELAFQSELLDKLAGNLASVKDTLRSVGEILAMPVLADLDFAQAVRGKADVELQRLEELSALKEYVEKT